MSSKDEYISLEDWLSSRPDKPKHRKLPPETPRDRKRFDSHCKRLKNGCLIHNGFEYGKGYAGFLLEGNARAHRVAYVWAYGEPKGDVHHTCENRRCVEPTHLKDTADGDVYPRHRGAKPETHCVHGHEFTPENTYLDEKTGWRQCVTCKAGRAAETYARLTDEERAKLNARRRERRDHITYEVRPCENCGNPYQPIRSTSQFCQDRACINDRQRKNRNSRLGH